MPSLAHRASLLSLLVLLAACGSSEPGGPAPRIESFVSTPAELLVGDPVELVPRFAGSEARI
ncbi:MAG: hypothetical protein ACXWLG_16310, partial [Myxococcaceae bacterium]